MLTHIEPPTLVTISEACRLLAVGRTRMYELMDSGELQTVKLGKRRLIIRASIDKLVDRLTASMEGS